MSSLRARATIIVLRVPARPSAVASLIPQCQGALLLKLQKAPSELDHTTTDPGVAGSGKPLFASASATFVRRTRQAGIARHCFAIAHPPGEHLMNEHICRLNADPDDASQQSHFGLWPALARRLF